MFTLALIQMQVVGGEPKQNIAKAVSMIAHAAKNGASVVLLPEAMTLGWTDPSALSLAEPIPSGQSCLALIEAAVANNVYVCSGLVEQAGEKIYNSAVLISPDGQVILHYRKINELEIAHPYYAQGDRLGVVKTPLGTFGLMICADAFADGQVISRTLGMMGAEVILSPSSWAVPADHDHSKTPYGGLWLENYCPVAKDFGLWIAGVSNVGWLKAGPWAGQQCIGCSMLINPNGKAVLNGDYGVQAEQIMYYDLEPKMPRDLSLN